MYIHVYVHIYVVCMSCNILQIYYIICKASLPSFFVQLFSLFNFFPRYMQINVCMCTCVYIHVYVCMYV